MRVPSGRYVLLALAVVPFLTVCALLWCAQRDTPRAGPVQPDWTAERLHKALADAGLRYDGKRIGGTQPGYYLKERGDRRTWAELAAEPHWADRAHEMRGYVVIVPGKAALGGETGPEHGQMQLGSLVLMGDPAMLRAIAEAVR